MSPNEHDEVLAVARASTARRAFGLLALTLLGAFLIYSGTLDTAGPLWRLVLVVMGGGMLWAALEMYRATSQQIELTATELRESDGTVLVRVQDIVSMDGGFFAFKPSNGLLIRSRTPGTRVWRPGLWWRLGKQIGIGGMTPRQQTKMMSETLAALIAARDEN